MCDEVGGRVEPRKAFCWHSVTITFSVCSHSGLPPVVGLRRHVEEEALEFVVLVGGVLLVVRFGVLRVLSGVGVGVPHVYGRKIAGVVDRMVCRRSSFVIVTFREIGGKRSWRVHRFQIFVGVGRSRAAGGAASTVGCVFRQGVELPPDEFPTDACLLPCGVVFLVVSVGVGGLVRAS